MAENEVVDEIVTKGPVSRNSGLGHRAVVTETVALDGGTVQDANGIEQETIQDTYRAGRKFSDSAAKLMDKLDAGDGDDAGTEGSTDPDDAGLVETAAPGAEGTVDAAPAEAKTDAVDQNGNEIEQYKTENVRLIEANKKLLDEMEAVRKAPRAELSPREKALDEAERTYLDDSVTAIRRVIATVLGVEDPNHKDVDDELSMLYTDLTSRELNIPLETSHKAAREAVRARQLLAKDRRERKAEDESKVKRASEDENTRKTREAATFIENRLSTKRTDGTSLADTHPMLMNLAKDFDGMDAPQLIWRAMEQGVKAGKYDPAVGDDNLIAAVAKDIEDHYTRLSERIAKAKPQPKVDAAKAAPANASEPASNDQRQSKATRTITNASASVAPATPVNKAEPAKTEERPKFKNDKERRAWALRHLPR